MFIFFATCYSTIINLQWYGNMWYMGLLIFIPLSLTYLFHLLLQLFSIHRLRLRLHLHSPILFLLPSSLLLYSLPIHEWATINFLSTITDLYPSPVFFPLLFALSSLFYRRGYGCGSGLWLWFPIVGLVVGLVVISDCDRRGRRSLGCGSLLSVLYPGELTKPFHLIRE